jgi:Flp pilus assembly protein TadG
MKSAGSNHRQRGAQIVEFALVLPFLILMLFLVIDFGFLAYNKAVITNASREAARASAVLSATPWTATNVQAVACSYAKSLLISTNAGTRTSTCSGTADPVITVANPNGNVPPLFGDPVTVQISYPYSGFLLNRTFWLLSSTLIPALSASTTMNHE